MEVTEISPQMELAATQADVGVDSGSSMDKDGFLKLLVAQLKNQDPLNPMSNEEWTQQMTQFSMLEELQNMGDSLEGFTQSNSITSAANLVGKEVTLENVYGETNTGIVEKIQVWDDKINLFVDGIWRDMSDLVGVSQTTTNNASMQQTSTL